MDAGTIEATLRLRDEMSAALSRAQGSLRAFDATLAGVGSKGGDAFTKLAASAQSFQAVAMRTGAALSAGITLPIAASIKAATDFESAFSNVVKTVGGFDVDPFGNLNASAARFRREILTLSTQIPVTADALAQIAGVGGQFGVAEADLRGFTKTVAELSQAVDGISGENAAAGLAQIRNIVGPTTASFDQLASTLVDLGNKGTSTEATILETARRFASAGTAAGATASQIFGMSAAVANLGFEAEVGGTALSKTFLEITRAVGTGGAELNAFASTVGMSADAFKKAWSADATGTFEVLINRLGELQKAGVNTAVIMESMFGKDIRQTQIVQSLALAVGGLKTSLNDSAGAFASANAHTEEARKKFATFEKQVVLLWNQIRAVGIELGSALIPVLREMVTAATPVVSWAAQAVQGFGALPQPIQRVVAVVALLAAAAGPLLLALGALAGSIGALGAAGVTGAAIVAFGKIAAIIAVVTASIVGAGALVAAFLRASGAMESFTGIASRIYDTLSRAVSVLASTVWARFGSIIESIATISRAWFDVMVALYGPLVKFAGGVGDSNGAMTVLKALFESSTAPMRVTLAIIDKLAAAFAMAAAKVSEFSNAYRRWTGQQATTTTAAPEADNSVAKSLYAGIGKDQFDKAFGGAQPGGALKLHFDAVTAAAGAAVPNVTAFGGAADKAADKLAKAADKARELALESQRASETHRLSFIGVDDIEAAAAMAAAIAQLPPGFVMARDAADEANDVISKGMRAAQKLALPIPKYMSDAAAQTGKLTKTVADLSKSFDRASLASVKIAEFDPSVDQIVAQMARNDAATAAFNRQVETVTKNLLNLAGIGLGDFAFNIAINGDKTNAGHDVAANLAGVFKNALGTLSQSFIGGGGFEGALKSIGTQIVASISEPLISGLQKMVKQVQASVSAGAAGASAIGAAWGGQTAGMIAGTTSAIAGAALATTSLGTAAATSVGASLALGAATMGIGVAAVGVYLLAKHYFTVSKAVKQARKDVDAFQAELWKTMTAQQQIESQGQGWAATLITVRDAYARMGLSAAMAEKDVADLLNTDRPEQAARAMAQINQIVGSFRAHLDEANAKFTPLLSSADQMGIRLPDALLKAIDKLREMGDLTEDNIALLGNLMQAPEVDYKKFEDAAKRYNINPDALGIGFQQFKTDTTAQQMIDDFDLLIRGGASVGTVLNGMREEISKVVEDSVQFGTTIPENMRPWIMELARTGQLVDKNGKAITDLSQIKFGDELKTSFEKITIALQELVDTLNGPFLDALRGLPTSGITIPISVQPSIQEPNGGDYPSYRNGGAGDFGNGTLALLHGREAIIPLDDMGNGAGGRPIYVTVQMDGETIMSAGLPYLDEQLTLRGI